MNTKIESYRLLQSIVAGAERVISSKQELNKINIFPVADGDTGSNLSSLMQSIIDSISTDNMSIKQLLNQISDAALIGARGNSGVIFAQYLNAVSENYQVGEENLERLIESFGKAVSSAYSALLEPKEGTILSVMRTWSETLVTNHKNGLSFENSLLHAKNKAYDAVIATQFQMVILKKNKLVDSGAKGFYYFIEGFTDFYCGIINNAKLIVTTTNNNEDIPQQHKILEKPVHRYCSEFIIKELKILEVELKNILSEKGDSLVLAGNPKKLKIHIHTNQPHKILTVLEKYGTIIYQKIDDMALQYEISQNKKSSIAIVTDSVADFPKELILTEQIHVLPMNIAINDQYFLDKLTINSEVIQAKSTPDVKMNTSQPSIQTVDALFSFLEGKYDHVIVITVSSKLSGTYQLISQRIKAKGLSDKRIHLFDSKLNSVAQGLLVKQATQLVDKGLPFEKIVEEIKKISERIFIYVAVKDLTPMIRSGRVPKHLGKMAQKFSLHPIVSLDKEGRGKLIGASFSQRKSMTKIMKKITALSRHSKLEEIAITHVLSNDDVLWCEDFLSKKLGEHFYISDSSSAIAIAAGAGSVAIAGILRENI